MILSFVAIVAAATLSMMGQRVSSMLETISAHVGGEQTTGSTGTQGEILDPRGSGGGVGGTGKVG